MRREEPYVDYIEQLLIMARARAGEPAVDLKKVMDNLKTHGQVDAEDLELMVLEIANARLHPLTVMKFRS